MRWVPMLVLVLAICTHVPRACSERVCEPRSGWGWVLAELVSPCFGLPSVALASGESERERGETGGGQHARAHIANVILRKGWSGVANALGLAFPEQVSARQCLSSQAQAMSQNGTDTAILSALKVLQSGGVAPSWLRDTCLLGEEAERGHWERFYRRSGSSFFKDRNLLRALFPALMPPQQHDGQAFDASRPCPPLAPHFSASSGLYQAARAAVHRRYAGKRHAEILPCVYCNTSTRCSESDLCSDMNLGTRSGREEKKREGRAASLEATLRTIAKCCLDHRISLPELFVLISEFSAQNVSGRVEREQVADARAPCGVPLGLSSQGIERLFAACKHAARAREAGTGLSLLDFISLFIKHSHTWAPVCRDMESGCRGADGDSAIMPVQSSSGIHYLLMGLDLPHPGPSCQELAKRDLVVVEMGCGVGNSVWPILRANAQRDVFVIGLEVSASAVALVRLPPACLPPPSRPLQPTSFPLAFKGARWAHGVLPRVGASCICCIASRRGRAVRWRRAAGAMAKWEWLPVLEV